MNRRDALVGLSALCWLPPASWAQSQDKPRLLGILGIGDPVVSKDYLSWFFDELRKLGWEEGRNLTAKYLYASGDTRRMDALAGELVALKPDVIFATSAPAVQAVQRLTGEIPIVFGGIGDPVGIGLVKSLREPGGNATGITGFTGRELTGKRLQLLKEWFPSLSRLAVMLNVSDREQREELADWRHWGTQMGVQIVDVDVQKPSDLEGAFAKLKREGVDALYTRGGLPGYFLRHQIASRAAAARTPTMGNTSQMVEAGLLSAYGPATDEYARQGARYVDRILRGEKPSQLPVQQPTRFQLVVNLRTAKTIGTVIPQSILLRADRVIE